MAPAVRIKESKAKIGPIKDDLVSGEVVVGGKEALIGETDGLLPLFDRLPGDTPSVSRRHRMGTFDWDPGKARASGDILR